MAGQQRSWHEQLAEARDHVPKADESGDSPAAGEAAASESPPMAEVHQFPFTGQPKQQHPARESVNVSQGRLNVRTEAGEASIPLSREAEEQFIRKAMQYQQAIINEKKANAIATIATAALSGLSAVAIGFTLLQGVRGKKNSNILEV